MNSGHFFAVVSRMKFITRWGLMRNTRPENLEEHSLEVAILAHALAVIKNRRFHGNVDADHIAVLAMFHDVSEIYTGDLPTPVKYHDDELVAAYKKVESLSAKKLLNFLPEDLRGDYRGLILQEEPDDNLWKIIKAADKLSALIKCLEEEKAGNSEFKKAASAQIEYLKEMRLPEVDCFMKEFLPSFRLTLDELG
ncbi:MAG TPA: 5'-deoxynucleotidase [Clostridia bacterium]|nr:5'-deoxynucleotidase [Clostridia bacterium]